MGRRLVALLAVVAVGLALGYGTALSAPAPDDRADGGAQVEPEIGPKIVDGIPVPDGKYRYVVALRHKAFPQFPVSCGGTLIDNDSVLTAAHCVEGSRPGQFSVLLGRTDVTTNKGVVRGVRQIFRHPHYTSNPTTHDAAVLKLSSPVRGIPNIKRAPVIPGSSLERAGSSATIAGWGSSLPRTISEGKCVNGPTNKPVRMREATVPIARDLYGEYIYNEYLPSYGYRCGKFMPITMIAAGYKGKTTCQGDSGGPLIKKVRRSGKTVPFQIGITSFGAGCGQDGYPIVYTEVNSVHIAPFITRSAKR